MKRLKLTLAAAALTTSVHGASAQTASEFRAQVAANAIESLCSGKEMNLLGQFIRKRTEGASRDEVLVQIDNFVTEQHQPPELARLHVMMLDQAYSGPKLGAKDFQGETVSPRAQALFAKAHMQCIQYMNVFNSDQ
ncbi:hypothetical protein [Paraburkholderia xenovorans]|uniref:hypothetical protein n=1 Tax=Paraburkholderia xenovorans TaxID=36873 RepID=UPI0015C5797A|nr:hypothetical protein [Paraburkholderia xenovorans]NPT36306.1 hypothetical protein [Paraburkholderia xenovorans]